MTWAIGGINTGFKNALSGDIMTESNADMPRKDNRRAFLCVGCILTVIIIVLLAVVIYLATKKCEIDDKRDGTHSDMITQDSYGQVDGKEVTRFTFKNKNGVEVRVINYGGIVTNIFVPDKNGKFADVVLGFDSMDGYKTNEPYLGAVIGRYANRIAKGKFSIDGTEYTLAVNNVPNALHGGIKGFDKKIWTASVKDDKLTLKYVSAEMEEGYPGELTAYVTYSLTDDNDLVLEYSATTTKKTVINLTNHAYFNLKGQGTGDIFDHVATITAESYLPVDSNTIPTGVVTPVNGTAFDLRKPKQLSLEQLDSVSGGVGYDHNYCFGKNGMVKKMARIEHPESGRYLEAHSTEPGMQFYTAYYLDVVGKDNVRYGRYHAFCLETQHYPDSPNQDNFPTTLLAPTETYKSTTTYKFGVIS